MAASYPASVKGFTLKIDGSGNIVFAAHVNDLQDEVSAVEGGLLNGFAHVLRPDSTGGLRDLGTSGALWRDLYLNGALRFGADVVAQRGAADRLDVLDALRLSGVLEFTPDNTLDVGAGSLRPRDVFVSRAVAIGTNPASAGAVRLANAGWIAARNAANGADINLARIDATDLVAFGANLNAPTLAGGLATADPSAALGLATKQYADKKLNADISAAVVNNTAAETVVYTFSVPGGTLLTAQALRLVLIGEVLNNDVGTDDLTIRTKLGGTVFGAATWVDIPASATRRPFWLEATIHAAGATNAQVACMRNQLSDSVGVAGNVLSLGAGGVAAPMNAGVMLTSHNSLALDSTVALTLEITVQFSVANVNLEFVARTVYLELIR